MENELNELAEDGWIPTLSISGSVHHNPWLILRKDEQAKTTIPILQGVKKNE